jgi:hypothetical protein
VNTTSAALQTAEAALRQARGERDAVLRDLASIEDHVAALLYGGRFGAAKPCRASICWPSVERMNKANLCAATEASFMTVRP